LLFLGVFSPIRGETCINTGWKARTHQTPFAVACPFDGFSTREFIDDDFDAEHREEFDNQYMRALFDYGFRQGRDGYPWKKTPPRFDAGWAAP
jgi:hypothetical protein